MGEIPSALRRDGRPLDPVFLPDEGLYLRVRADQVDGEDVSVGSIRLPAQSVNRQKYCANPQWVLLPKYCEWGVALLVRGDVPEAMSSPSPGGIRYRFTIEHVPEDENYSHSEIRVYRGDEVVFNQKLEINATVKKNFRMQLAEKMRIIQRPQPT